MTTRERTWRFIGLGILVCTLAVLVSQCSDTEAPAPPSRISIYSGDSQYSLRGTALLEPLVVRVATDDGSAPEDARVIFSVAQGGGTLSRTSAQVDKKGLASVEYTLGPDTGTNIIEAEIYGQSSKPVLFKETSANFYCPEQTDTFQVAYATPHYLLLVTHKSGLYTEPNTAGVVEIDAVIPGLLTGRFAEIRAPYFYDPVVFDIALSARGDRYVAARLSSVSEILTIDQAGNVSSFARLSEDLPYTDPYFELSTNPSGLLVGCDANGPFVVGCHDSLTRYAEATYENHTVNSDALAVDPRRQTEDPLGEDIYFIDKASSALKRLALDNLSVEARALETVASLSADEAASARGMVCDPEQGNVYILVDSDDTKEILEVTPAGTITVVCNFFDRGTGDAAGQQRDLAFDLLNGRRYLYTLDTLNDNLLRFDVANRILTPMFADSLNQSALSNRGMGGALLGGERVGLVVLREQ